MSHCTLDTSFTAQVVVILNFPNTCIGNRTKTVNRQGADRQADRQTCRQADRQADGRQAMNQAGRRQTAIAATTIHTPRERVGRIGCGRHCGNKRQGGVLELATVCHIGGKPVQYLRMFSTGGTRLKVRGTHYLHCFGCTSACGHRKLPAC
jgi:hypothetical protein